MNEQDKEQFDHIKIELDGLGKGNIWVNGVLLKATTGIDLRVRNNEPTEVSIHFIASFTEGDCEASK